MSDIQSANPLLAKIKLPGKIYQLPSKGIFYNSLELSPEVMNAEVHVHAMTSLDEINMKNPDMLFSGKALEAVCASIIPDIKRPMEILAKDVDALMIFMRLVSYGQFFDVDMKHTCENAKEHTYTIDLEKVLAEMTYLDETKMSENYTLVLENGQIIKFMPVRYRHVIELLQDNNRKTDFTSEDLEQLVVKNVLNLIESVDGLSDKKLIEEWLHNIPSKYMRALAVKVEALNNFGPNTMQKFKCKDCGEELLVELPLNPINFFSE